MKSPTFSFFLKRYLKYRSYHVRYASSKLSVVMVNVYLKPEPSWRVMDAFSLAESHRFYQNVLNSKISVGYKNRLVSAYKNMASFALRNHQITATVFSHINAGLEPLPKLTAKKIERGTYTKEEIQRFLMATREEDRLMFELFCYLGARISEFSGLTWDCFNPELGTMEIKQQLLDQHKGKWVLVKVLKTSESYRVCPLPSRLTLQLKEYWSSLQVKKTSFIFSLTSSHSTPYGKTTFRMRMDEAIIRAGLPRITPHCFRHSKATMLLSVCRNMEEAKAAAKFLGHSLTMLMETYGHAKEETMVHLMERLE